MKTPNHIVWQCVILLSNRNWPLDGIMPYKQMAVHFDRVKLSPCTLWRHIMGAWVHLHLYLTPALEEGEWSASSSAHFTLRKRACSNHWTEGWVGPTAGLIFCKEKSLAPVWNQTLNHPGGDLVTTLTICQGWVKCGHSTFHCFTVHFDSLCFIYTNLRTFSYKHVLVF